MKRLLPLSALTISVLVSGVAHGAEQTVILVVKNMTCASCPYVVRKTLAAVPGVSKADVSFEARSATVTFDDQKTNVAALADATTRAGYPATVKP